MWYYTYPSIIIINFLIGVLDAVCTVMYIQLWPITFMVLIMQVPKGHVWLEGDNKTSSYDSREFGPLPYALIHSKVFYRVSDVSL